MGMMLETTVDPAVHRARASAHYGSPGQGSRPCGCGCSTDAAGSRSRSPPASWSASARRMRSGPSPSSRSGKSHEAVRSHPGSHHPELPGQAGHRDARRRPTRSSTSSWPPIAVARLLLGPTMRIQAPPNLVRPDECLALLGAGVDDWGGVSPLTPDHVNPERPWPNLDTLAAISARGRLHPHRADCRAARRTCWPARRGSTRGSPPHVAGTRRPGDRAGQAGPSPTGLPWQEPDEAWESAGRIDLQHRDRHRGPQHRDPQRPRQRLRRLGRGRASRSSS